MRNQLDNCYVVLWGLISTLTEARVRSAIRRIGMFVEMSLAHNLLTSLLADGSNSYKRVELTLKYGDALSVGALFEPEG